MLSEIHVMDLIRILGFLERMGRFLHRCYGCFLYGISIHTLHLLVLCTPQEVSTMLRYGSNAVIFLFNNGAYTIEVEIHDGPYNILKVGHWRRFIETLSGDCA